MTQFGVSMEMLDNSGSAGWCGVADGLVLNKIWELRTSSGNAKCTAICELEQKHSADNTQLYDSIATIGEL